MRGRRLSRVLGVSLLMLVGAMAVSSSARAEWVLQKNSLPVEQLKLTGTYLESEFLFGLNLGIEVNCTGGTTSVTLKKQEKGKKVSVTQSARFTKCKMPVFEPPCYLSADPEGKELGQFTLEATGELIMEGSDVYASMSALPFATVYFSFGELCPLVEFESAVGFSGIAKLEISSPSMELKQRPIAFSEQEFWMGEEEVDVHGSVAEGSDPWLLAHMGEETGSSWSIQLKGL